MQLVAENVLDLVLGVVVLDERSQEPAAERVGVTQILSWVFKPDAGSGDIVGCEMAEPP
jgi:hypothetical protein